MVHIKKKKEREYLNILYSLFYHKDHIPSSRFSRSEIMERTFSFLSFHFANSQQMALMTKKNYPVGLEQVFRRKKMNFLDCLIC